MTIRKIEIKRAKDIAKASKEGRELARKLALDPNLSDRLIWAIREIALRALRLSQRGSCTILDQSDPHRILVRVLLDSEEPGIVFSEKRE